MEEGAVRKEEEEETADVAVAGVESSGSSDDLHRDLLEAVISRLSLFELLPASCVSRSWRRAVALSLDTPSRLKPWLIVRPRRPTPASRASAASMALAYDPGSDSWMRLPSLLSAVTAPPPSSSSPPLRCSQGMGNLLYVLSPSRLSLSWDPLNLAWRHVGPPQVWRTDPLVGTHHVVVAGGACDFEDDPLAVEVYRLQDHPPGYRRLPCESMPLAFKNSASRAWLSVAASDDHRMFVLAKHSGTFASLDLDTLTWGPVISTLNYPGPSTTFFSVIGFSDGKLIQVGLDGDATNVHALRIWELRLPLNPESGTNSYCERNLLGEMPRDMLERLTNSYEVSSIEALVSGDFVYIYDPSASRDFFFCDFTSGADDGKCGCSWSCFQNPVLAQGINPIDKFVFTSTKVTINDLRPLWNHEISRSNS